MNSRSEQFENSNTLLKFCYYQNFRKSYASLNFDLSKRIFSVYSHSTEIPFFLCI